MLQSHGLRRGISKKLLKNFKWYKSRWVRMLWEIGREYCYPHPPLKCLWIRIIGESYCILNIPGTTLNVVHAFSCLTLTAAPWGILIPICTCANWNAGKFKNLPMCLVSVIQGGRISRVLCASEPANVTTAPQLQSLHSGWNLMGRISGEDIPNQANGISKGTGGQSEMCFRSLTSWNMGS